LRYEAKTAVGNLYDAFTLRKQVGNINELIEGSDLMEPRVRPVVTTKEAIGSGVVK
jgi:hypothetical protein